MQLITFMTIICQAFQHFILFRPLLSFAKDGAREIAGAETVAGGCFFII
jgi:hypothetical protein